jgi:hypothetical protein
MAASKKMTVLWDVVPCSLVEAYRGFRGACCLRKVGKLLPDYIAQHPRRQSSLDILSKQDFSGLAYVKLRRRMFSQKRNFCTNHI